MCSALCRLGFMILVMWAADAAADLVVYDDALQNPFQDWSYPSACVCANGAPTHNGSAFSIAFTGDSSYNAVSFEHPANFAAGAYSGLRFFVNGGATGGQQLALNLYVNDGTAVAGPIVLPAAPQNAWAEIDVSFSSFGFSGSFNKFDLQTASGVQPTMYIDDISFIAAASDNYIFGDSLEPEYMFVPQYGNNSIKVYQRTTNTADFTFVREAPLGAGVKPNAVSFAPDGGLWVVDDGSARLRRYTLQSILGDPNPAPTVSVGPVGNASSIFDLAFFGSYGYVSQSDFGATNQILKFALSNLNAGNNVSTSLTNAGVSVPVCLAFDTQGRLWICNYGTPGSLVRMSNLSTGAIDVTISGNNINNAEGLAFDEYGSLWIGDNIEPTMYAYGSSQLGATGSPTPIGQINTFDAGPNGSSGFVGGIAFDRHGDVRVNYEYDQSVRAYKATAAPWSSGAYTSYTSSELHSLAGATVDPGRGGIAIWPRPHTLHIK